jgi:hypothetical protein
MLKLRGEMLCYKRHAVRVGLRHLNRSYWPCLHAGGGEKGPVVDQAVQHRKLVLWL